MRVFLDVGHHLVSACYTLEGDGPLILKGYDIIQSVEGNLRSQSAALGARATSYLATLPTDASRDTAVARMRVSLAPVHRYFSEKMTIDFAQSVGIMKAARYWNPATFVQLHRSRDQTDASINTMIEEISILKWIAPHIVDLKAQALSYYTAAKDFGPGDDEVAALTAFFRKKEHTELFPTFCSQYFDVILLQTSEGTVERSFSDFSSVQSSEQEARMEESLCAATMSRYNARDELKQ